MINLNFVDIMVFVILLIMLIRNIVWSKTKSIGTMMVSYDPYSKDPLIYLILDDGVSPKTLKRGKTVKMIVDVCYASD